MDKRLLEKIIETGSCYEANDMSLECTGCPLDYASSHCIDLNLDERTGHWMNTELALNIFKKEYAILKIKELVEGN